MATTNVSHKFIEDTDANLVANLIAKKAGFATDTFKFIANINGTIKKFVDESLILLLDGTVPMTADLDLNGNCLILDTDADTKICGNIDDVIRLELGGSERFRFTTTGLGIGTTAPTDCLHILDTTASAILKIETDFATGQAIVDMLGNSSAEGAPYASLQFRTTGGSHVARIEVERGSTALHADLLFYISQGAGQVEAMRINEDKHVGVGTTSPDDAQLEVEINDGTDAALQIKQSGAGDIFRAFDGSFERFTIYDGGKVGISVSGDTPASATETFELKDSAGPSILFENTIAPVILKLASSKFTIDSSDTGTFDVEVLTETGFNVLGNNVSSGSANAITNTFKGGNVTAGSGNGAAFTQELVGGTGGGDGNGGAVVLDLKGGDSTTTDSTATLKLGDVSGTSWSLQYAGGTNKELDLTGPGALLNSFHVLSCLMGIGVSGPDGMLHIAAGSGAFANKGYVTMEEISAPGVSAANKGRMFLEDNGGGKTRLMIIFSSGAAQQIAIEP